MVDLEEIFPLEEKRKVIIFLVVSTIIVIIILSLIFFNLFSEKNIKESENAGLALTESEKEMADLYENIENRTLDEALLENLTEILNATGNVDSNESSSHDFRLNRTGVFEINFTSNIPVDTCLALANQYEIFIRGEPYSCITGSFNTTYEYIYDILPSGEYAYFAFVPGERTVTYNITVRI